MKKQGLFKQLDSTKPNYIYYKAALDAPEEKISVAALDKRCNFTFSETFFVENKRISKQLQKNLKLNAINSVNEKDIKTTYELFTVVDLGGTIGHALFSRQLIRKRSFIGFYSGNIVLPSKNIADDDYILDAPEGKDLCITAKQNGNFLRFMPHLPSTERSYYESVILSNPQAAKGMPSIPSSEELLKDPITMRIFDLSSNVPLENIATENVQIKIISYQNIKMVAFYSLFDIPENTLIGWSYGNAYWSTRGKNPKLFFKNGTAVPENDYMPTLVNLNYLDSNTETTRHLSLNSQGVLQLIEQHQNLKDGNVFIPFYTLLQKALECHLLTPAPQDEAFLKALKELLQTTVELNLITMKLYTYNRKGELGIKFTYQDEKEKHSLMHFFSDRRRSELIYDDLDNKELYFPDVNIASIVNSSVKKN